MNLRNRRLPPVNNFPLPPPSESKQEILSSNLVSENIYSSLSMNHEDQEDDVNHDGGAAVNHVNPPLMDPSFAAAMLAFVNAGAKPLGKEPKFSGSPSDIIPEEYIAKLNTYGRVNNLSEQRKLGLAGMNLSGVAETWYNDLPEDGPEKTSWRDFCSALIQRFTIPNADMNHFRRFQSRKQKKTESVEDYGEDLKKLIKNIRNKTMVPEAIQVTTFINGLLPNLRRTMDFQGSMPNSLVEAILNAKRIENANSVYFESVRSDGTTSGDRRGQDFSSMDRKRRGNEPMVMAQVVKPTGTAPSSTSNPSPNYSERPQRSTDASSVVCHRCKLTGHFASNCPTLKDVTCYRCQQTGHFATRCPNPKVVVKEERKETVRVINTSPSTVSNWRSPGTTCSEARLTHMVLLLVILPPLLMLLMFVLPSFVILLLVVIVCLHRFMIVWIRNCIL